MKVLIIHQASVAIGYLENLLAASDYSIYTLTDLDELPQRLNNIQPDCILLNPAHFETKIDVHDLVQLTSSVPYIMFSEEVTDDEIASALHAGAADFLKLPMGPKEILARVVNVLRHANYQKGAQTLSFNDDNLKIVVEAQEVYLKDELLTLTKTEFSLLYTLANNPTRVFSRSELMESMRGLEFTGNDRAIDSHIKNLRLKIEDDTKHPSYILTIHGSGYRFGYK